MRTAVQSPNLQVPYEEAPPPLRQAGQVALAFLKNTGQERKNQAFLIFGLLATHADQRGEALDLIELEASSIKESIAPKVGKEPSAWISPLWKQLEVEQEGWALGMEETARALGTKWVPTLNKVPGSPAQYQFLASPLSQKSNDELRTAVPEGGIRYTSASVAPPGSAMLAALRVGWLRNTLPLAISVGAVVAMLAMLVLFTAWLMVSYGARLNTPVTTAQITLVVVWGTLAYLLSRVFCFLSDLGDLGIVIAPEAMVPFKEDHVTLEIRRNAAAKQVSFAFVRYAAICPLCGGNVLLHEGNGEFAGRIIGRCRLAPREHVYSFDQQLHVGHPLRSHGITGGQVS